jgi:hypothetical protein
MVRQCKGQGMENWELGSKPFKDGTQDIKANLMADENNGGLTGQLWFKGMLYTIGGNWAAAGSVAGRNVSAFALWGSDGVAATDYIAATGTFAGTGMSPTSAQLNLIRVRTSDGQQFGWDGELRPLHDPWT